MKHVLIAGAAFALAISAAHAAPSFGGGSLSQSGASRQESESASVLTRVQLMVLAKLKGDATAPVAKSKRPAPTDGRAECPEAKKAEEEKQAEAKPGLQAGPEPIYLAF